MPKFQVVIERHVVYEIDAADQLDAENQAWDIYTGDDLSDPVTAEILQIEG